jgi:tetratricopeptide (TPR) repeat protein
LKDRWAPRRAAPAKPAQRPLPPPHITLAVLQYQAGGKSPGLVYHAAQAYRAQGDRAKAIELYDRYLQLAPDGPAAAASRAELEHLRDVPQ